MMGKRGFLIIILVIISIGIIKQNWTNNNSNLRGLIVHFNKAASERTPFKRNEKLTQFAQEISRFQKSIIGQWVKSNEVKKNNIVDRQQKIINQLITNGTVKCNQKSSNFGLTILPSDIQLNKNGDNLTQPHFPLLITSKGKYTYFQLIITAYEDLSITEVKFTETKNESIECYLGDYVYCSPSPYFNKTKWYQDPLFPFKKQGNTFSLNNKSIKKGSSYPIWVKLKQVNNPEILQCEVKISGQSKCVIQTSITINKILDKRKNLNLTVLNSYYPGWTDYYYQDSTLVKNNLNKNNLFIEKYDLDPTLLYCSEETGLYPKIVENTHNKGPIVIYNFEKFKEFYTDTLEQKKILKTILKREQYLSSINQLDNSFIYLYDELPKDQNYKLVWTSKWLKRNGIKSKLLSTSSYLSGNENIDIWCVLLQNYESLKNKYEGEMWVYICNSTTPPYPNMLIESNKKEFNELYTFLEKRPRIKGFLYYATNNWRGNLINHEKTFTPISSRSKDIMKSRNQNIRWPDIPWISYSYKTFNGDGYLFYPNSDGSFLPSARLFLYHNLLLDLKNHN
jgi:hypothetical protein